MANRNSHCQRIPSPRYRYAVNAVRAPGECIRVLSENPQYAVKEATPGGLVVRSSPVLTRQGPEGWPGMTRCRRAVPGSLRAVLRADCPLWEGLFSSVPGTPGSPGSLNPLSLQYLRILGTGPPWLTAWQRVLNGRSRRDCPDCPDCPKWLLSPCKVNGVDCPDGARRLPARCGSASTHAAVARPARRSPLRLRPCEAWQLPSGGWQGETWTTRASCDARVTLERFY